jgi:uncharacterized membrane protein (DUF4010 family)
MDLLIAKLGLALAIGLLVGLERGWRERNAPDRSRTAGIRTYGLAGLLGGVTAALDEATVSPFVLVAGILAFTAVLAWYKSREAAHDRDFSVTGVIAGMLVFTLGAMAVAGDYRAAAAGGAALAAVLASRETAHGLLRRLTWVELRSALVLAAMTAIVLPLLPDRTIDPWGGLNPFEIWFFTVLAAAISFFGYAAVKMLGETRGLVVSAIAGALVSSTAVTVALARLVANGASAVPYAGAASLAAMVSVFRVLLISAIVEPAVVATLAPPAIAGALAFAIAGLALLRKSAKDGQPETARNPFELAQLLGFAAIYAVVATASAAVAGTYGSGGLFATTAFSAVFDVDAASLAALRLVGRDGVTPELVAFAILAAMGVNALGRLGLAMISGPSRFWLPLAGVTVVSMAAGAAALFFLHGLPVLPASL